MLSIILIVLLILLLVGAFPRWPYNVNWGYSPFNVLVIVLIIVLVLALMGKI